MSAEELANQELKKLEEAGKLSFPIDPFKVLKESGVTIELRNFENLAGIIINDSDNITRVGINVNNNLQRQRFTAAHEYCHFIKDLNKENGKVDVIECLNNSKKNIEKYANDFAGYFLMPTSELKKVCEQYKNNKGYVDFENITIIAEYFGVSFYSCLNRIAYGLKMIDGDTSKESLLARKNAYKPQQKRKELINNTVDSVLLSNLVRSMYFVMANINNYTGQKFLQNYIYNDNKLEGVNVDRKELNYMLADLNYNGIKSKYYNDMDEKIIMTLGNIELQKYVINTKDQISFESTGKLHSLLYKYVPYPDDNGKYRTEEAVIKNATIQPANYQDIPSLLAQLDDELQFFIREIEKYDIGKYIEQVAYFMYKFIVIHPFRDGNGRISRAILNWFLIKKKLSPIYIDKNSREEYYNALSAMDLHNNPIPLIMFIERRMINSMVEIHKYLFVDDIEEYEEVVE